MLKILLIGANGYIGSRFNYDYNKKYDLTLIDDCWHNVKHNNKIIIKDYCLLEKEFINNFDVILLLAAHSSVGMCNGNFSNSYQNNVVNFINLIEKINLNQKLIYASSSSVYGFTNNPVTEKDVKIQSLQNYDTGKIITDLIISRYNIEYYGLRFGTVNGFSPYTRDDIMLNSMVKSALINKEVNIYNPEVMRPILGISDLVKSLDKIIESNIDLRGIYNLNSFNDNVFSLGKKVSELTGSKFINNGSSETPTYDFMISSEKFCSNYNFSFNCTAENIIKELIENNNKIKWTSRKNPFFYNTSKN